MNCKYKAIKKAKEEKEAPEYEMPKQKAISEHKKLVKVLKTGKGMKKEAMKQGRELKEIIKEKED